MTIGRWLSPATLSACILLAGCGDADKPANYSATGVVKAVARVSPGCSMPRIFYVLSGGCGPPYYRIELTGSSGTLTSSIGASRVNEDDLRRIISERITVGCYRAPDETRVGCTQGLSSINWNGRELLKSAK